MKNRRISAALIVSAVVLMTTPVMAAPETGSSVIVQMENVTVSSAGSAQKAPITPRWEKQASGRSYWRMADGKILKTMGLQKLGGKLYYLNKGGSRAEDTWKKIDGKVYYFQKNGVMRQKQGWIEWNGNKYYTNKDGSRHSGFRTVKNRLHYFDERGRVLKNKKFYKIGKKYYNIDGHCNVTRISDAEVKCTLETRKYIQKHTNSSMTNSQKFRACFNDLLWNLRYHIVPFDAFDDKDWPYKIANSVYDSYMSGDCYGFACCVAACAKELGYTPYVVITTGDHAFVMIDGLYYDNMGPLFGAGSHFAYNTLHKVKF